MSSKTCYEEALKRRKEGRSVIPIYGIADDLNCTCGRSHCESPGKHPILNSWKEYQQRLPTINEIEGWWRQNPTANAAELTGNGTVVGDIDRTGAEPEFATRTVRTGGGGLHYYWSTTRKWKNSAKGEFHVRGESGYVLIPPSRHKSGKFYSYISEIPASPIPRDAIKLIDPEAVFSGNRHDTAGRIIGHLFKEGKTIHEVRKELLQRNNEHFYPPLSQGELNRYVDDIASKERTNEAPQIVSARFLPMLEFLSTYTPAKEQWLVQSWLPTSSAGIISGLPGAYKTWLVLDLAISLASGKPFLGAYNVPAPKPVILCQLEDDYTLLAERIRMLLGSCAPTFEDDKLITVLHPALPIYLYDGRRMDVSDAGSMRALEEVIVERKASLLIIDPMNAAVNMEDYGIKSIVHLNRFKEIRDRTGCTPVFSHHDQKGAKESTRTTTYGTVFFDAWKEFGWNITKLTEAVVRVKRHAKLVPHLSDVTVQFLLDQAKFNVEES